MKDIRTQWKALAAAKSITREDIAALCLYRTLVREAEEPTAAQRLRKSFSPITNKNKLANGSRPFESLEYALRTIKYSSFAKWLDEEDLNKMTELAKKTATEGIK